MEGKFAANVTFNCKRLSISRCLSGSAPAIYPLFLPPGTKALVPGEFFMDANYQSAAAHHGMVNPVQDFLLQVQVKVSKDKVSA